MPFTLIKGTFQVVGYQPDGDSIRFQADNVDNWDLLDGPTVELNARQHAQLRIEAIDTLGTHYQGFHQPLKLANAGTKFLWKKDKTNKGFDVSTLSGVTDKAVILPKLFRRIVSFMGNWGGIEGFKQFLAANPDPVFELSAGHSTNLDTFVEVQGNSVRLTVEPERLIFKETA